MSDWKPWYEKMAEFDSAADREAYLKGVFSPAPMQPSQVAGMAVTAGLANWGVGNLIAAFRGRRRRQAEPQYRTKFHDPYNQPPNTTHWDPDLGMWR